MSDIERISGAIDGWLNGELIDSRNGHNRVLDDWEGARAGFAGEVDIHATKDENKNDAHFNRYSRTLGMIDEPTLSGQTRTETFFLGKLIHHSLMFTSGGFRVESFLRAGNQADYEQRRFAGINQPNGATSPSIPEIVAEIVAEVGEVPDLGAYMDLHKRKNLEIRQGHQEIYQWFTANPDRIKEPLEVGELPVDIAMAHQKNGLTLAASHIAVIAAMRGGLEQVPFLQPRSITMTSAYPCFALSA